MWATQRLNAPLATVGSSSARNEPASRGLRMTYDPASRSNRELLADRAAIMRQLRERDIIRTNNSPTGDIAEALVERALQGVRSHFSQAGWDVRLPPTDAFPDGERVQVKSVRVVPWSK